MLAIKTLFISALLAVAAAGCSASQGRTTQGRTTQMFPDCTQVSAEEQQHGKCMYRPEAPDRSSH
jgi:hypothetical protein